LGGCGFFQAGIGDFSDRDLEHGVVLADRIDVRLDRAVFGDLVRRGLHSRIRRKGYREELIGIAVLSPALGDGGAAAYEYRDDEHD
jgi:hypothetical protein